MFDFKFDWKKEMELGIPIIDEQHKVLFRIARDIEQILIRNCEGLNPRDMVSIVCELREFSAYHFYEEEQMMRKAGYKGYEKHVKAHADFTEKVQNIDMPRMGQYPNEELKNLKDMIQDWIFGHMLIEDPKFVEDVFANTTENERKKGVKR